MRFDGIIITLSIEVGSKDHIKCLFKLHHPEEGLRGVKVTIMSSLVSILFKLR